MSDAHDLGNDHWRANMEARVTRIEARVSALERAHDDHATLKGIVEILVRLAAQSKSHGETLAMILTAVQSLVTDPAQIAQVTKNLEEHTAALKAALDNAPTT